MYSGIVFFTNFAPRGVCVCVCVCVCKTVSGSEFPGLFRLLLYDIKRCIRYLIQFYGAKV
jgi:hypothetical protein